MVIIFSKESWESIGGLLFNIVLTTVDINKHLHEYWRENIREEIIHSRIQ